MADADQIGLLRRAAPGVGARPRATRSATRCTAWTSTATGWRPPRSWPRRLRPLRPTPVEVSATGQRPAGAAAPRRRISLVEVWAALDDPDALVLGTWLHDVGKAWPGDHSVGGEAVVRTWLAHMGYDAAVGDRVGRLVRHHLLLPDVATQRDIDDPEEVIAVALAVGDVETLDGLYLLAIADGTATGPAAWSPWKELLVTQLYQRARLVLEQDADALRALHAPEAVLEAARRAGDVGPAELEALVAGLPPRYLLNAGAEQLVEHARMLATTAEGVHVRRRPGPVAGTVVVSLLAPDRRGLFADCAGALTGHGWEVLDARAFTRADGVALDWFTCTAPEHDAWDRVARDVRAAAHGELDVVALVARREARRDAKPPPLAAPIPVAVVVDERRRRDPHRGARPRRARRPVPPRPHVRRRRRRPAGRPGRHARPRGARRVLRPLDGHCRGPRSRRPGRPPARLPHAPLTSGAALSASRPWSSPGGRGCGRRRPPGSARPP